jgi:hypothetical protein
MSNVFQPRVFRMAGWYKVVSAIAALLMAGAGASFLLGASTPRFFFYGVALIGFGLAGFIDVLVSRVVLDRDTLRVVSLVRRRTYRRDEFVSAKVDGGMVVLRRKDDSWLKLPGTGANALSVRNTIDAWIKAGAR